MAQIRPRGRALLNEVTRAPRSARTLRVRPALTGMNTTVGGEIPYCFANSISGFTAVSVSVQYLSSSSRGETRRPLSNSAKPVKSMV